MNKQKGFTLIELVVVMVILGILAAFAVPKFYNFSSSANTADLEGLAGAINSANVTAHGAYLAAGNLPSSVSMEGSPVNLVNGYPAATALGIGSAVNISSSFAPTYGTSTVTYTLNGSATCTVVYTAAASTSTPPTIAVTSTGC